MNFGFGNPIFSTHSSSKGFKEQLLKALPIIHNPPKFLIVIH